MLDKLIKREDHSHQTAQVRSNFDIFNATSCNLTGAGKCLIWGNFRLGTLQQKLTCRHTGYRR